MRRPGSERLVEDVTATVPRLRVEYGRECPLGIGEPHPRLSWTIETDIAGWSQSTYEVEIDGNAEG